jgi:CheY-like chemotaxis protein
MTFLEAVNGYSALEILAKVKPDLIITDITMPGMDGFQLLSNIRKLAKAGSVPVIAYTASVMKEQQEKIKAYDFAGLLVKPLGISDLYREMMKVLPYTLLESDEEYDGEHDFNCKQNVRDKQQLLLLLEGEFSNTWKDFRVRQPIRDVRDFGSSLKALGEKHSCGKLARYGDDLFKASGNFNIEAIIRLVNQYPDLVNSIASIPN